MPSAHHAEPARSVRELLLTTAGLAVFWMLFASFIQSFYRDDNVGGGGPVLADAARSLLHGQSPTHTDFCGGGGGAYLSPWLSGVSDPLSVFPALLLEHDVRVLMNVTMALHLACFGGGGFLLGYALGAAPWARRVAALSLGFSGYYVVWAGNWSGVLAPYAFLPWLLAALIGLARTDTRNELVAYQCIACAALYGTFLTGLLFAALYGGLTCLVVVTACCVRERVALKRFVLRLLVPTLVFVAVVLPVLAQQASQYAFLGERKNDPIHWIVFAVPWRAYLGLLWPLGTSTWRGVYFPDGHALTNVVMMCGTVPVWYLGLDLTRRPGAYLTAHMLVLALGVLGMVLVLSPGDFGLAHAFAVMPVVSAFRWPFRALPAFHLLLVAVFLTATLDRSAPPSRLWRALLPVLVVGTSLVAFAQDLEKKLQPGPVMSWFAAAPSFDDPETWSPRALAILRRAGNVANACKSEVTFHLKPRLYFYGMLGAEYQVRTVHLYAVPPFKAYAPLGTTIKGCLRKWDGIRRLLEEGPKQPLPSPPRWRDLRGPSDFDEIVRKTFVGAVIVEPSFEAPMRYFTQSAAWLPLERHAQAMAFVRADLAARLRSP